MKGEINVAHHLWGSFASILIFNSYCYFLFLGYYFISISHIVNHLSCCEGAGIIFSRISNRRKVLPITYSYANSTYEKCSQIVRAISLVYTCVSICTHQAYKKRKIHHLVLTHYSTKRRDSEDSIIVQHQNRMKKILR